MNQPDRSAEGRVRLVDVARAAGVSKTTVSDALNGSGRLPEATRDHVREVARRLGYRPNATARLLRAGRTRLLGLAAREYVETPWAYADLAYFAQLSSAASRAAMTHGYGVVLLPTTGPNDSWLDLPLDGVFVVDPIEDDKVVADFLAAGVPVVSDRRALAGTGSPWIDFDYGRAIREVLDHLAAVGARRVGAIAAAGTASYHQDSVATYRQWCQERGQEPLITCLNSPGLAKVLQAVETVLGDPDPPDALFVLVEVSPPLLLDMIRKQGRSVPDDLLLVCATEEPTAPFTEPPVSTLSFLPAETAEAAVDMLVDLIEGRPARSDGRLFRAVFHVRASALPEHD
ncbi:LacI family DNA-binding transcriptional regulator [Nonomuraea sediminis]|uniref:LacI family DNA-binding transcriptional regulator n=1 Tax=Nonomuraea sediminis TaxID=2835864 RepID=UPI001BDC2045|nr:LacI family DNA-binding transcriptional regulator [Nonomuraea sediminis]